MGLKPTSCGRISVTASSRRQILDSHASTQSHLDRVGLLAVVLPSIVGVPLATCWPASVVENELERGSSRACAPRLASAPNQS